MQKENSVFKFILHCMWNTSEEHRMTYDLYLISKISSILHDFLIEGK